VATGATDLRKSFDGLSGLAQSVLRQDPLSGHLFIFANRRRDRVKILHWDRSGFVLLYKRLEKGTFRVPERGEIEARELMMLLEGIDTEDVRERRWYRRAAVRR